MTGKNEANSEAIDLESAHDKQQSATDSTAGVRSRNPQRKTTIQLEEGQTSNDEKTNGSSGSVVGANTNGSQSDLSATRRRMSRDQSDPRNGLGGNGLVPRRATMDSNPSGRDLRRSFTSLFTPEKRLRPAPSNMQCLKNIIFYNWINLALLLIPVSWALHFAAKEQYVAIFVTSFIAIMPLAQLLSYGTEEIALRVGQTIGGLLNASLGNAVELIVAIIALFQCEYTIVQTSLVGSVLSNILLVLGTCFFVGGLRFKEQEFKQTAAQLNTSLLAMAVISALIPAGFHATLGEDINDKEERSDILKMSRGVSVLLLIIYAGYLYFTLSSHKHLYDDEDEEEETPTLSVPMALGLLVVSTVLVGVTSEWLVDAIDPFASQKHISKTWIGLILLPIASNAAEHVTAVVASYKNKVDLAMGVAVGSSIQISLFVLPLLVIIAWIANKPLSLLFDPFVAIMLFLAVLIVNYALADGRANYMEGWLLIQVYLIAALVFWFVNPNFNADLFLDGCDAVYPPIQ